MSGIAGIAGRGKRINVERMLHAVQHRGGIGHGVIDADGASLGAVWPELQPDSLRAEEAVVQDRVGDCRLAQARMEKGRLVLLRDRIGVAPLYYGRTEAGDLCFASEVKALLKVTRDVNELPPGCRYDGSDLKPWAALPSLNVLDEPPESIAQELRRTLEAAVRKCLRMEMVGAWLSGGLDSSAIAALVRPCVRSLHTFAAGLPGAPDLPYARQVAEFIGAQHHEIVVGVEDLLKVLPDVIYHLESFDALLVRSSVMNYLASKVASEYVAEVFSGEGGDELFAGYEYLKALAPENLPDELVNITGQLHNTALQRVDRCASAHGLLAHVCFLDREVVDCAFRIPTKLKLWNGVEKWILRQAMAEALPQSVLERPKAKFWEGAGVGDLLADHADKAVTDEDFHGEKNLPDGSQVRTKEELTYYRIFKGHFGEFLDLSWMGRTKNAPMT